MSWDEWLFGWVWKRGQAALARSRRSGHPIVTLAELHDRLRIVAIALGGRGTLVVPAEAEGGVRGRRILLPTELDVFADPRETAALYLARTALGATMIREGLAPRGLALGPEARVLATVLATRVARRALIEALPAAETTLLRVEETLLSLRTGPEPDPLERLVRTALVPSTLASADRLAEHVLAQELADPDALFAHAHAMAPLFARARMPLAVPLWGWLSSAGPDDDAEDDPDRRGPPPRGKEVAARLRELVRKKKLGASQENENPLVHSFEKLHTLEEHQGGQKRVDGEDELEAHAEALDELDLREVIRSDEEARSLLRSDAMIESGAGEVAGSDRDEGLSYDEWHEAERSFRRDWCRVRVVLADEPADRPRASREAEARRRALARRIDEVRGSFLRVLAARRARPRQLDGPEVDDDAIVDRHGALAAGTTPPDRLYVSRRRRAPELAVMVLVDRSLSTDGWIGGERVLDLSREAVTVIAEALEGLVPELAVAGFSSHTRKHCRFTVIKAMNEPWAHARLRLGGVEPEGYTRIGPALRHATHVLEQTRAERRLLLLVTDGKPNDYDRYEGRYGVHDVRHAVLEAASHGVHVHALAIDPSAEHGLAEMFRDHRYTLLRSPHELGPAMGRVIAAMER